MNFFVTGDSSIKANVNLKFVTPKGSHGANFADDGQTLSQSFSIAQEIFGRVKHGKIDFVLIGLAPDCLFQGGNIDENLNALSEYLKLCVDSGAKPVAVIFPIAPNVRDDCRKKFVEPLRKILAEFKKIYDFEFVDLFDAVLPKHYFKDEILTSDAVHAMSSILTFELYKRKIFSFAELCRMSYKYFDKLSYAMDKVNFTDLMSRIFRATVDELRLKNKIKIAFVLDHAAVWCGDELYKLFADNPRFETTVFMCRSEESTLSDTRHDFEQFKSRGLNVKGIFNREEDIPPQDVVIFLRPYLDGFPKGFRADATTPRTLWVYIHYCYEITTVPGYHNSPIFRTAWKCFFDSEWTRNFFDGQCRIGIPRAYASGLPKMDFFFDASKNFSFPWKMTRPDAKKIVWAPHYSIDESSEIAAYSSTFQHNYKFMYEFAKAHPETSWVVKPHPRLLIECLIMKFFPSLAAFEEYIQAWNDLPNAQVFTGAYYQPIFATSDGMILDSGSFIAEYQYTHKPLIFLTRDKPAEFTELGQKILDVSYCVNGRNLDGIAALLQKVFIDGDDPLKDARQKVFDELLNYRRVNGMSGSEFVFRSVADELTR